MALSVDAGKRARYVCIAADSDAGSPLRAVAFGFSDLVSGLADWRLWTMLGWNDVRQRYRRSAIGPFWITLSMATFVLLLGFIYAKIFSMDVGMHLPYVAGGLIAWGIISGSMVDACTAFTEGGGILKQIRMPFSLFILRTVWRAFIIFLHTVVLMLPIWLYFGTAVNVQTLLVIPGLVLVIINQVWMATIIAVLSTRFRDVAQLVATAIQIAMLATPIMWPVNVLSHAHYIADLNPFYHLVELIRAPLLGEAPAALSWTVVAGMIVAGYGSAAYLLGRSTTRIVYWL
jgi:ABC-type polysaccharide/polyol phosphate export permease